MPFYLCPTQENLILAIIIPTPDAKPDGAAQKGIELPPVFLCRRCAQFLPFDFFDGFPAFAILFGVKGGIHNNYYTMK
jgi:hypothetical protein